jgi:diacylglycerol kinase family enzyme
MKPMEHILDPTIASAREPISYVPRPRNLQGLRIGLIDNTRQNAEAVLLKLAEELKQRHGASVEVLLHKHQRAPLKDVQLADLKGKVDFVIAGVGD